MLITMVLLIGVSISLLAMANRHRQITYSVVSRDAGKHYVSTIKALLKRQINLATTGEGEVWTSQPGLLRTFDATGKPLAAYKLYSSGQMEVGVPQGLVMSTLRNEDAPANWDQYPAEFVDLNEAVEGRYPVVDPAAKGAVSGFSFETSRGVEMPVRWLYVLEDGQIVAPQRMAGAPGQVRVQGAADENPVVARIAFWSDDETCRLNVNTAVGGEYWAPPATASAKDIRLAWNQPVAVEYTRYPRHPARIDMATVFPEWHSLGGGTHAAFLQMAPRYAEGGSIYGTRNTFRGQFQLPQKLNLFYPHEDDWAYAAQQALGSSYDASLYEQRRFFVTSTSLCSDLNLFGKPRVSLWPIHANDSSRSLRERKLAISSTVPQAANGAMYFQRQDPTSASNDASLTQNRDVLNYLRAMTEANPPGFSGGTLHAKFGTRNREHILAGIFDFTRSVRSATRASGETSFTPRGNGEGQITPTVWRHENVSARGMGRLPFLTEAAIHFYASRSNSAAQTVEISAVLLLEFEHPGQGYPNLLPRFSVSIDGANAPKAGPHQLDFSGLTFYPSSPGPSGWPKGERKESGMLTWVAAMHGKTPGAGSPDKNYPYVIENLPMVGPTFPLSAGEYEVVLSAPDSSGTMQPYQTLVLQFPDANNLPIPPSPQPNQVVSFQRRYEKHRHESNFFRMDTVRSVEYHGDLRLLATMGSVPAGKFLPGDPTAYDSPVSHVSSLNAKPGRLFQNASTGTLFPEGGAQQVRASVPQSISHVLMASGSPGDWETGAGNLPDGAWGRHPDGGFAGRFRPNEPAPYFSSSKGLVSDLHQFPNRELASAVRLGALNRGVDAHWETLLFCPNPAAGTAHPGFSRVPDFLWLDLFRVPVTEPFPLSDVASTQGRVNLNSQIVPFTYIERTTALHGALRSVQLTAIPQSSAAHYKEPGNLESYLYEVDAEATVDFIKQRFSSDDVYRSETEICGIHLVPKSNRPIPDIAAWWNSKKLTGDNLRERPYAHLLPLLTTRSHAYRVYYKVEVLQQPVDQEEGVWKESVGKVLARQSGAMRLVRDFDEEAPELAGHDVINDSLEPYFRIYFEELGEW